MRVNLKQAFACFGLKLKKRVLKRDKVQDLIDASDKSELIGL